MKQIPEWEFWDWKSIILTPLFIGGLIFLFYAMNTLIPDEMRSHHSKKYFQTVYANFITWHRKSYVSQGKSGATETTLGYEVTYSYTVYGQKYTETDLVPNTDTYQKFLGELKENELDTFLIKYNPEAPENSQIVAENKYYQNK